MFGVEFVYRYTVQVLGRPEPLQMWPGSYISVHETIWTIVNGQPHYTHVVSVENSVYIEHIQYVHRYQYSEYTISDDS